MFNFEQMLSQDNQLKQIPIDMLIPYHKHKFKLYEGERLDDMVQSIKDNGILTPVIVRSVQDKYEILAGHNRVNAAKLAGLTTVPGIVKMNLPDDEAEMYVIETNLMQRGFNDLRITERAAVIALRHKQMFTKEKIAEIYNELSSLNKNAKKGVYEVIGSEYSLSHNSIARLIRVNMVVDELKPLIDDGKVALRVAVDLSYIGEEWQKLIAKHISEGLLIDMKKADTLRNMESKDFSEKTIIAVLKGEMLTDKSSIKDEKQTKSKTASDVEEAETLVTKSPVTKEKSEAKNTEANDIYKNGKENPVKNNSEAFIEDNDDEDYKDNESNKNNVYDNDSYVEVEKVNLPKLEDNKYKMASVNEDIVMVEVKTAPLKKLFGTDFSPTEALGLINDLIEAYLVDDEFIKKFLGNHYSRKRAIELKHKALYAYIDEAADKGDAP